MVLDWGLTVYNMYYWYLGIWTWLGTQIMNLPIYCVLNIVRNKKNVLAGWNFEVKYDW